jgi:hypothetical protein
MAKQSGLGDALYAAGVDLSGDTSALRNMSGGPSPHVVTGINKSAFERLGGHIDGTIEVVSHWNPTGAHVTWSALPTTDVQAVYLRGTTIGGAAAGIVAKQANYDWQRRQDGAVFANIKLDANGYGIEWGVNLTAGIRTDSGATNGTAVDLGAAASFGMRAYLQVIAFTGTDATVTIQDSTDGSTGWGAIGSGAFTQVTTAPTVERIETGATENVKRYIRATTSTTGGFSDLQFVVMAVQNLTMVTL